MTNGATTHDLERHLSANPSSPLFARLAESFLRNGEVLRAERLCEEGLALYPEYTTGLLIHARCLAARGLRGKALEALDAVAARYPGNILLAGLGDEWRESLSPEPPQSPVDVAVFTDLPAEVTPPEATTPPAAVPPAAGLPAIPYPPLVQTPRPEPVARPGTPAPPDTPEASRVGPRAAIGEIPAGAGAIQGIPAEGIPGPAGGEIPLAAQEAEPPREAALSVATAVGADGGFREPGEEGGAPPMPVPGRGAAPVPILQPIPRAWRGSGFIESGRIVSRTLAEIYASQGAIGEAVETYRLLLGRMPELGEELGPRLRELEERLRSDHGGRPAPGNAKAPA